MSKILVFQHAPHKTLGILDQVMTHYNLRRRYVNFSRGYDRRINFKKYQGLIILGGSMGVYERKQFPHLNYEIEIIRTMYELGVPILGICLGSQLIAHSFGGAVYPHKEKEIGWHDVKKTKLASTDPLFKAWHDNESVFQWHGDTFDLPDSSKLLIEGDGCKHQAFKLGDTTYGFQFHLESDSAMIKRWLATEQYLNDTKANYTELTNKIQKETQIFMLRNQQLAEKTFSFFFENFIDSASKVVTLSTKDFQA
jgi:GMP synthase (glutamine-hydrolysing)